MGVTSVIEVKQVISALRLGFEISRELCFQNIVTMDEDDTFKEAFADFDLNDHILPMPLTDPTNNGGLFGI